MYLFPLLSFLESESEFCSLLEFSFSRKESWLLSDLPDRSSRTLWGILLGLGLEPCYKNSFINITGRQDNLLTRFKRWNSADIQTLNTNKHWETMCAIILSYLKVSECLNQNDVITLSRLFKANLTLSLFFNTNH